MQLKDKLLLLNRRYADQRRGKAAAAEAGAPVSESAMVSPPVSHRVLPGDILPDHAFFTPVPIGPGPLENLLPALDSNRSTRDGFWRLVRETDLFWNRHRPFLTSFWREMVPERTEALFGTGAASGKWLFVDLETCGLSRCPLFLIGLLYVDGNGVMIEQLFARDHGEEAAVIDAFCARFAEFEVLCTFNGRSFDWPFLASRAQLNGVALREPAAHVDLLHFSRRHWRHLTNHKLQTLERELLGYARTDDLPGALVPQAYMSWVEDPLVYAREVAAAIHHNALDLVALAEITVKALSPES